MSASNTDNNSSKDARSQSYWFHILAQPTLAARNLHAVKLVDKAWQQGDRVCIVCDSEDHARELDDLLWNVNPESFIPHDIVTDGSSPCAESVGILVCSPVATEWDTVIILSATLPADANQFKRLALVAHNDAATLDQARAHFKQLRALGIEPKVHDLRKNS